MSKYQIGQRWMSESEPELGLGVIVGVIAKIIKVQFPGSEAFRTYGFKTAPLKRVIFSVGDKIKDFSGMQLEIEEIYDEAGLIIYSGQGVQIIESELGHDIGFHHPEEKLFNGLVDSDELYQLRYDTLNIKNKLLQSKVRGLMGGRMAMIPHQLYVADSIAKRPNPRVLLADEVGLGKTIEAGLILHHGIVTGSLERVLIIVPDTLIYQWFLELRRRFQLNFTILNQEVNLDPNSNPFMENQLVLVNIGLLKGSPLAEDLLRAADWDMLVIDEAHQLQWEPTHKSFEYALVEEISAKIPGLILLTATPEQLGVAGHFARLHLLDPHKFHDLAAYKKEAVGFKEIGVKAKQFLLEGRGHEVEKILDQHGTGRVLIRNTRSSMMSKEVRFFPTRTLKAYPLIADDKIHFNDEIEMHELAFSAKIDWLVNFLNLYKDQKVLLISRAKSSILKIEKKIKELIFDVKVGVFHSELSLMARDRQAAYFADPKGSQILLCTEIGSEGRNFQFAQNMILFDIPKNPDLMEQRIGRLDRIGQKNEIFIHVPFIQDSWEEIFFRWYHNGLNAFEKTVQGGSLIYEKFSDKLLNLFKIENGLEYCETLEKETKHAYELLCHELEDGRDLLIELNSFNREKADSIIQDILDFAREHPLQDFMERVYHHFGVDIEDLDGSSHYLKPGHNMFIPCFPHLPREGMSITYSRERALEREDLHFMSWDHPMVIGIMDLIISEEFGNVTVATWVNPKTSKILLEANFLLAPIVPQRYRPGIFFPPTLLRILIDTKKQILTEKASKSEMDEKIKAPGTEKLKQLMKLSKDQIRGILETAKNYLQEEGHQIKANKVKFLDEVLLYEIERLQELKKNNGAIRDAEIELLQETRSTLLAAFQNAELNLDSLRFIF